MANLPVHEDEFYYPSQSTLNKVVYPIKIGTPFFIFDKKINRISKQHQTFEQ